MSYDIDVRVNVFEANIRMLGGLLSAHLLAQDPVRGPLLMPGGYSNGLLVLAEDLGRRLLPAFVASPTGEQHELLARGRVVAPPRARCQRNRSAVEPFHTSVKGRRSCERVFTALPLGQL